MREREREFASASQLFSFKSRPLNDALSSVLNYYVVTGRHRLMAMLPNELEVEFGSLKKVKVAT